MARIAKRFDLVLTGAVLLLMLIAAPAEASDVTILYQFSGGSDGGNPGGPLAMDAQGNLYGTTATGGRGNGVVFRLSRDESGSWIATVLHAFAARPPSHFPNAGLALDSEGNLYGSSLGENYTKGFVFRLAPPAKRNGKWDYSVLFNFPGSASPMGGGPSGQFVFNKHGDMLGVTQTGGDQSGNFPCACGVVFELAKRGRDHEAWPETVRYTFQSLPNGNVPISGLTRGSHEQLFGTTYQGGSGRCLDGSDVYVVGCGTVFELNRESTGWTESIIHEFKVHEENQPVDPLVLGHDGALYGVAGLDVFRLNPPTEEGGTWRTKIIYEFPGGISGTAPTGAVRFDAAGNLYGATRSFGIDGPSTVFELSPTGRSVPWSETTLATLSSSFDGEQPWGGVIPGPDGVLYGAARSNSSSDYGYVFSVTPKGHFR